MDHYLDFHLRPQPDLAPHHLLSGLYTRLHRALVQLQRTDIGVSFPSHDDRKPALGTHLRLHGPEASLQSLMATGWLNGAGDFLQASAIAAIPGSAQHRVVGRVQAKSNVERLRRRAIKRHGLDAAAAALRVPDSAAEQLRLPFVTLGSRSTGQASFPLFIRHGPMLAEPVAGSFNSYGLGQQATIPWF